MNIKSLQSFTAFAALLPAWSLLAAQQPASNAQSDEVLPTIKLEPVSEEMKNRIGLDYRMGLNIMVDFRHLGGLALSSPGPATGSAVNRNYDNGYSRVDVSTNAGALTWNWGYENPNSLQTDELSLQSYRSLPNGVSKNQQDDPQHGGEIFYQRELMRGKRWHLGAEAAFGSTSISVSDSHTLKNTSFRTNDTYPLGGIIAPLAPYHGTFEGPGPLIPSVPQSRSTDVLARSATATGERTLDADVFMLRLGPYLELPLYKRLSVLMNAGLTLASARSQFSWNEKVTISDPANNIDLVSGHRSGSGSQTDFLVGWYAGGSLEYALTKRINLLAGAQYQAAGHAVNTRNGKNSLLDMGSSIIVSFGAAYSF